MHSLLRFLTILPCLFACLAFPAMAAQKKPALTMNTLRGAWHADSTLNHPYYILFLELKIKTDGQVDYALVVPDELHMVMRDCKGQGTASVRNGGATITLEQGECLSGGVFGQSRLNCTAKDAATLSCTGYINNTVQWEDNPAKRGDIWYEEFSHIPGGRKKTGNNNSPR